MVRSQKDKCVCIYIHTCTLCTCCFFMHAIVGLVGFRVFVEVEWQRYTTIGHETLHVPFHDPLLDHG